MRSPALYVVITLGCAWSAPAFAEAADPSVEPAATCPRCGRPATAQERYCPACGKRVAQPGDVVVPLLGAVPPGDVVWLAVGVLGQLMFAGRFLLQWLVSERAGRSVVPPLFWYMSLIGGLMVLSYGIRNREVVVILSQAFNPIIYLRNIMLMRRGRAGGDGGSLPA
jgi:lipid-A-disaccharide synthase-like uncharacterized protein